MPYKYQQERRKILNVEGQKALFQLRDKAKLLLAEKPAFQLDELLTRASLRGDPWYQLALVDRLVELGEIQEVITRTLRFYASVAELVEEEPLPEFFTRQTAGLPDRAVVKDISEVWDGFRRLRKSA